MTRRDTPTRVAKVLVAASVGCVALVPLLVLAGVRSPVLLIGVAVGFLLVVAGIAFAAVTPLRRVRAVARDLETHRRAV